MKWLTKSLILLLLLAINPIPSEAFLAFNSSTFDTDSLIVKYKDQVEIKVLSVPSNISIEKYIDQLESNPLVEYVEPNVLYNIAITPSDTHYDEQWYLKRIKTPEAWNYQSISPAVVIAVIDSGVQIQHPDLRNNIWFNADEIEGNKKDDDRNGLVDDRYGWDFINNTADPSPKFKPGFTEAGVLHGTVVAGIAAAAGNNNEGITGVTWNARIMSLKALDDAGNGDTASVVRSIDYAIAKGANIINLSFVSYSYSRSLHDAIKRAHDANIIVLAPAGNESSAGEGMNLNKNPIYPACYKDSSNKPLVVGVAATDAIDQKAPFSGFGSSCISLSAPGVSFFSTAVYAPDKSINGQSFNSLYDGYWSGTSVAVPLVSGALALLQGANPSLSPQQTIDILLKNTDDINALNPTYVNQLGRGRLNVTSAVLAAREPLFSKEARLVLAPASQSEPFATITKPDGEVISDFLLFNRDFRGGVNLTSGDLDNDGTDEIIAAPKRDLESDIRIFDHTGKFLRHFLAYPMNFTGGVHIATADLNSDGKYEIITVPASGLRSDVKIFSGEGRLQLSFLAYPASFTRGASVTVGDVMGDARPEIVVGTAKGGIPQVKVFSSTGSLLSTFVVGKPNMASGLRVSLLDIDANPRRRQSEIVITRQSNSTEAIITDYKGTVRRRWSVFPSSFRGDVQTVTADIDQDGSKDIIAFPGEGGGPHVRIFNRLGNFTNSFYGYSSEFIGGIQVAAFFIKR